MAKYRLLIVDDEQMTRYGLAHLFDWSELNVEVVGEADDGVTALPLLDELRPDILFTDVKMVYMDGIALAEKAREKYPDLKIVFLSGYSDVEYVRSALKVQAFDYILKPVDYNEIKNCFHKVTQQIEAERLVRLSMQKMEDQLSSRLPTMKEHFLASLIKGQVPAGEKLREQMEELHLKRDQPFSAAVVILDPDEGAMEACRGFQNDWPLLSTALKNISAEIMEEHFQGIPIDDPFVPERLDLIFFIYAEQNDPRTLQETCGRIKELIKEHLGLCVSLGIGKNVSSLQALKASYDSASEALKHRLYLGGECVISYDVSTSSAGGELAEKMPAGSLRPLLLDVEGEALSNWVDELFSYLAGMHSTDAVFYRNEISRYIFEAHSVLCEQLGEGEEGALSQQSILNRIFHSETLEQMRKLFLQYCENVQELIRLKNDSNTRGMIQQVQKEIRERYNENLTVNELASSVYLTPTYLCLLFRQATGTTINHYQTVVRMEKAKELLLDLSNKLYDVSYAVGYMNPSYFSRQFKKYTGLLPSEYRDKMIADGGKK